MCIRDRCTGRDGAGIGGGHSGKAENIRINGGVVTATGGEWGYGIGSGYNEYSLLPTTITITGGTVKAIAGKPGAAIGALASANDQMCIRDRLKAIYEYMDSSGRVALPDVVDYFIDFYEDRKAHGMIAEKSTIIYQKGGYTRKDVEKNILSNPFKRFEDMRFLMRCKDVETIEVNPIIFRKLTREDWLHIVDVCDKSLEKYYLRLKK